MVDVGALAIAIAWVFAVYAVGMSLAGAYWRKRDFVASGENASLAVWGLTCIATAALLHALVTHDFNFEYVAHYSSSTLPIQLHGRGALGRPEGLAALLGPAC